MPNNSLLPAPLRTLVSAVSLYRVQVEGNSLAPRLYSGDLVIIAPAVDAEPKSIAPGSIVLVAIEKSEAPGHFQQTGLFVANADGDLAAGSHTVERGKYIVLGIAQGV